MEIVLKSNNTSTKDNCGICEDTNKVSVLDMEVYRTMAFNVIEMFEELLDKHNITIPDTLGEGNEGEGRIFGDTYCDLEVGISHFLKEEFDKMR